MHKTAKKVSHARNWVSPGFFKVIFDALSELRTAFLIFLFIFNLIRMRLDVLVLLSLQASVLIKNPLELKSVENMCICLCLSEI